MGKNVMTGLYSDEAYEALMLVSAFESFNLRDGLGTENVYIHDNIFAPTVQRIVYYNSPPARINISWGYTAEIERSAEDGEIIIYDYSASSQTSNDWIALPNKEKKLKLAIGIQHTLSYLTKAYPACSRKISLRIVGPCYAEPTNYMGRLAQFKNDSSRYRDFNIDLHTLQQLSWWFGDIHIDNESYNDLIGIPWDPFKAKGLYEVRKQQKVIRDEFFEKLESMNDNENMLIGDFKRYVISECPKIEMKQHKLEEGIL